MINVIGMGYIGLPTALMLAACSDENIVGTDYDEALVEKLNNGELTFEEKDLDAIFERANRKGIKYSTEYQKADMYIVSVPTPYVKETKKIDPKYVLAALNSILDICDKGAIVVIESTISPNTIDRFVKPEILKRGLVAGEDIHLVHAPERIIPGNMIYELEHNSRTIGADDRTIGEKVKEIYSSFCRGNIIVTDIRSAEMSKVVENTYRDINIAFANELAKICRKDNMDVYEIIRIANEHPRVNILTPGPGVGGHCISVDPWFLVGDYPEEAKLITAARNINDSMPLFVLDRILDIMKENDIKDFTKVGLYGLTYKEDVDDTRESPTLQFLEKLERLNNGWDKQVKVFDPYISEKIMDCVEPDFDRFIEGSELIVIMTGHTHIKNNSDRIADKIILDTKNICHDGHVYKL
ncbi:MAG: nucleotide sugar dehydrogenase [Firmicutes bacterium]|nr:nucleotide sugar dehydrogenase [Bacillota bacterium]